MASETLKASDQMVAVVHGGSNGNVEVARAPFFVGQYECWDKDSAGNVIKVWEQPFSNSVCNQGRAHIFNRLFASDTRSTAGLLMFLHSATLGTTNIWSQISASQVVSYGNSMPAITFATTQTAGGDAGVASMSCTASFGFNASTQTCSGAGFLFYTSASGGTNLATVDARLYAYGTFPASQLVQNGNTLSVTVTLSYA